MLCPVFKSCDKFSIFHKEIRLDINYYLSVCEIILGKKMVNFDFL